MIYVGDHNIKITFCKLHFVSILKDGFTINNNNPLQKI